jgi:hypothetical protein
VNEHLPGHLATGGGGAANPSRMIFAADPRLVPLKRLNFRFLAGFTRAFHHPGGEVLQSLR